MDSEGLSPEQQNNLSRMTYKADQITELLTTAVRQEMLEVLESLNVASAILFERASCTASLDTQLLLVPAIFLVKFWES